MKRDVDGRRAHLLHREDRRFPRFDAAAPHRPQPGADGVMFVVVKARGTLEFPETRWSIAEVQRCVDEMRDLDKKIAALTPALKQFTAWRDAATAFSAMMQVEGSS